MGGYFQHLVSIKYASTGAGNATSTDADLVCVAQLDAINVCAVPQLVQLNGVDGVHAVYPVEAANCSQAWMQVIAVAFS